MAVTDDQLDQLLSFARELGQEGVLGADASDHNILSAVLDRADEHDMRTEDEYDAPLTIEDLPAWEDRRDIVAEYAVGAARRVWEARS